MRVFLKERKESEFFDLWMREEKRWEERRLVGELAFQHGCFLLEMKNSWQKKILREMMFEEMVEPEKLKSAEVVIVPL